MADSNLLNRVTTEMDSFDEVSKAEVSGSGAFSASGGVAAGEEGVAVGGDVFGNIIKAVNVINIVGGVDGPGQDVLRSLGNEIKKTFASDTTENNELIQLVLSSIKNQFSEKQTINIFEYLQITGKTFGSLLDEYGVHGGAGSFPFGDFLKDMIASMGASELLTKTYFEGFGLEKKAKLCQSLNVMFAAPLKYRCLPLPMVEKAFQEKPSQFFPPHEGSLFLYRRSDTWPERELSIGHFYQYRDGHVICPLQFRGRDIVSSHGQQRMDYVFFGSFASALLADFLLFIHKSYTEQSTVEDLLKVLRRFKSQSESSNNLLQ